MCGGGENGDGNDHECSPRPHSHGTLDSLPCASSPVFLFMMLEKNDDEDDDVFAVDDECTRLSLCSHYCHSAPGSLPCAPRPIFLFMMPEKMMMRMMTSLQMMMSAQDCPPVAITLTMLRAVFPVLHLLSFCS